MPRVRVIADDLTGACDVGAALMPWPGGVSVLPFDAPSAASAAGAVAVRNTQSRTLAPAAAAARVTAALTGAAGFDGVLLKKIDTGLRGALGAELDAAVDALGASEAFVLPAIPEVGRTTLRGHQLIDGVPVHETAFGRDPQNPVADSEVAAVIAATSRRRTAAIHLEVVRGDGLVAAVDAERARGASVFVCDACTAADLGRAVRALLERPRPLVVAGSIGVAGALRDALLRSPADGEPAVSPDHAAVAMRPATADGILLVVGSAHPRAHALLARAVAAGRVATVEVAGPDVERAGAEAAGVLARGRHVALVAPARPLAGGSDAVLAAMRGAAASVLAARRPRGLVVVGGETAFVVLDALGHPTLQVDGRLGPLTVRARFADGSHAGMAVVTKGGSSGDDDLLARIVDMLDEETG
jgi:uncharacterized protein YgbK (DUF1537 family)